MSAPNQPIPDWLFAHIQQARDLFGVGGAEWHITAKMSDKPGGSSTSDGTCQFNFRYLNATLEFNTSLENNSNGHETAIHEVGHVALAEIEEVVEGIVMQIPEERRDFFREQFGDAIERYLQRISRSFVYHFDIQQKEEADAA